jgi:hypothetical protein
MRCPKAADGRRDHAGARDRQDVTHGDRADFAACGAPSDLLRLLGLLERRAGFGEEALPHLREDDAARLAHEQVGAQHGFQGADLRAERRRGDIQSCRRPREVQLLRDGHEVSEVP